MHILAIDAGSYSVKYISSLVDRKKCSHLEMGEIIILDFLQDHPGLDEVEAINLIIQEIIDLVSRPDTKMIYQADQRLITTRFLNLPVKSKKKAEMMLPFQLEEDLPFPLSEVHYSYKLERKNNSFNALIEIVKYQIFDPFYDALFQLKILPNILTTESSIMENFFHQISMNGPFCVLDIGHSTTKAYFFYNSILLMSHISYVGGKHINEMISENYKIPMDEAIQYKHQNAFFLTSTQYDEVDREQREFAVAMDKVFSVLTGDFLRWKIGFKLNLGVNLQNVYLCGGTSNIKFIDRYLSEKWEIKAILLETFDQVDSSKIQIKPEDKSKFALVNMIASGSRFKNRFINILSGKYLQASSSDLPLHSYVFMATRVAVIFIFIFLSLLTERFFINKDIKNINLKIAKIVKNKDLNLSKLHQLQAIKNPQSTLSKLVSKQREVRQEISLIQSAIDINALSPLVTISQISANSPDVTLIKFTSEDTGQIIAIFSSSSLDALSKLKDKFSTSSLKDMDLRIDEKILELSVRAISDS